MPGKLIGEPGAANRVKTLKRDVGVLISSPNARAFYHLDIRVVTLWHIQGEKTMSVYPGAGRFAPDPQIEAIVRSKQSCCANRKKRSITIRPMTIIRCRWP
jgi:hypothetical protein